MVYVKGRDRDKANRGRISNIYVQWEFQKVTDRKAIFEYITANNFHNCQRYKLSHRMHILIPGQEKLY